MLKDDVILLQFKHSERGRQNGKNGENLEKLLFNYNIIIKVIDYKYVITMRKDGKYDILDLEKMQVIYTALPDMKEVMKRLEEKP